jgi:hypothetical protein
MSNEKLAQALSMISLSERDTTTSAADKVQAMARIARKALQAHAAEKRRAREGVTEESKVRAWNEYRSSAVAKLTTIHELDVCWAFEGGWDAALEAVCPDGQDAKDAARYRWLRSCGAAAEELAICTDYGWVAGSDFDETIDAAMAHESGR